MIVWAVLNGALLIATLLPLLRAEHYLIRGWDFPRLQICVVATASLMTQVLAGNWSSPLAWAIGASAAICIIWQMIWIFPYTLLAPVEVVRPRQHDRSRSLRILAANILQPNRRAEDLLAIVEANQPDIFVALEADRWWQERLDIVESLGFLHTLKCPQDNLYGMLLYSRLELLEASTEYLVEDDVPSMHVVVRLRSGEKAKIHFLHPSPPSPTENEQSTQRDAELIMVGRRAAEENLPVIVAGDLNDVAWSATTRLFRKISGLLDPRVGRGMFASFHAGIPFMRWPLDHVFHSRHFCLNNIKRLPSFGSDHFPLSVDLQLDAAANAEGLEATAEEQAWAGEKVAAENVEVDQVP